jgi:hypothetical protein
MWNQLGKDWFSLSTGNNQSGESSVPTAPGAPAELDLLLDPESVLKSGTV